MASLDLDENKAQFQIRGYEPGSIKINDQTYHHSLIVMPDSLINWAPQSVAEVTKESFADMYKIKPDILLIGTGAKQIFIDSELYGELINIGIGIEIMSTQSACRTYNALSAEDRNVAAALIIK